VVQKPIALSLSYESTIAGFLPPQESSGGEASHKWESIAQINDSFGRNDKYVVFYQLVRAVWKQDDAGHLEKLRAAFDTNADDLASQVAAKVMATNK
jgi:hypothetical protein